MRVWRLKRDVELKQVLTHCLLTGHVDRLLLALPQNKDGALLHPESRPATERIFADRILEWRIGRRWPGTISYETDCHLAVVEFSAELVEPMCSAGPKLFDWRGWPAPALPEDLCLYRQGAEWPSLVSVTHERDAWLLAPEKPASIETEESDFTPEELYIPPASHGFIL
ncbi:MAG: hypothetical protein L0191_13170 [Acidobacteria bacterium]|nr:hypothetical protein [Acidobacteriota bacterium]